MDAENTLPASAITGLLLAGGQGRRMGGSDKGLLMLDGQAMASRVMARLQPQVGALLINANRNLDAWSAYGLPVISDVIGGFSGPLAGIHAGMLSCATPWLVTAPCDSPFLPDDLVARLAAAALAKSADLAVVRIDGRLQPVFALLHCRLRGPLQDYLADGQRKMGAWLESQQPAIVDFDDASAFRNINTPEDLANATG